MGRAFTVSMNLNFSGYPIGAALAGVLVTVSIEAAIVFGVAANIAAAILAYLLIPRSDGAVEADGDRAQPNPTPAAGRIG
jgi:hypothetical protein